MTSHTPHTADADGELRSKLTGIIAPVGRNENSSLGSSTYQEAVDAVLALIKAHTEAECKRLVTENILLEADLAYAYGKLEGLTGKPDAYLSERYPDLGKSSQEPHQ